MAKTIRSIAEAIGIIEKEAAKMGDKEAESKYPKVEPTGYCVECGAKVTHPGAYFCRMCSEGFYNNDSDAK